MTQKMQIENSTGYGHMGMEWIAEYVIYEIAVFQTINSILIQISNSLNKTIEKSIIENMAQTMIKRGDQNTAQELIDIGDHHHYDFHTKSHLRRAIQYYNRALAQQPTAIAYAKLATVRMKLRKSVFQNE